MPNRDNPGTLVVSLRPDNTSLIPFLMPHFSMTNGNAVLEHQPPLVQPVPPHKSRHQHTISSNWPFLTQFIDALHLQEDLVGVVGWNSSQIHLRALCLAAKEIGIPSFEIDHGCMATYLHGHFEADPVADHIFCSPEHAEFLRAYGYNGEVHETGRPLYDTWEDMSTTEARARIGLSIDGPVVLHTTTWCHEYSAWSDEDYVSRSEGALVAAMQIVQSVEPCAYIHSLRGGSPSTEEMVGHFLEEAGIADAIVTKDHNLQQLIPCADVVVAPKGSAAAEAVIAGKPAIILDFRPQLDDWAWKKKGIIASRKEDPKLIAEDILKCLVDPSTIENLEAERRDGRLWFNGPGNAAEKIAEIMVEKCYS